jgi:hypothetical protein
MLYAHVEDGSVTYMGTLPKNWRNTSNLDKVSDSVFLKSLGWVPLIEKPATIGENEVSDGWVQTITKESVTTTERKRDMTKEEKEARTRNNALTEIGRLEALETPTRIAEAVLTEEGKAWLQVNRDLIAVERAKL